MYLLCMTTFQEAREQGIGSNFMVLNPADGFRKDDTLWFGECAECGARVTHSYHNKAWTHTLYEYQEWFSKEAFDKGMPANHSKSRDVGYCPKVAGEVSDTVRFYRDGDTTVLVDDLLDK
jgi:hypothetical protein